jgi:sugar phosphate isomerase/epimerase
MTPPIALQLYSVRDVIARSDYESVVRQVAQIGYAGVETAGFPGTTSQAAGKLFKELGLQVTSIHKSPIPTPADKQEVLDILGALDTRHFVALPGLDDFKTVESIRSVCDKINAASAMLAPYGIKLHVHNHWWEYLKVGEKYAYEYSLDFLMPEVCFEIDTYWVKTAGVDPAKVVKLMGNRAPLLHIKDGPAQQKVHQTAVGEGVLDFPDIVKAAAGNTEWMIIELDSCATDMIEAVRKSHQYLTSKGLARGK